MSYERVKEQAGAAFLWRAGSGVVGQVAQFGFLVALTRLLTPEDFGFVGMAATVVPFLALLGSQGLAAALVQMRRREAADLDAIWTGSWVATLLAFGVAQGIAGPVADFFREPELVPVVRIASFSLLMLPGVHVPRALRMRAMDFRTLSIAETTSGIVGGVVAVGMALRGWGYWALVARPLARDLLLSVWLWGGLEDRPRLTTELSRLRKVIHFSGNLTLFETFRYWTESLDYVLIGRFLGSEALGYYSLAYQLATLLNRKFVGTLGSLSFSAFANLEDRGEIARAFSRGFRITAYVLGAWLLLLAGLAALVIEVLYGARWLPAALPLSILSLASLAESLLILYGGLYLGLGRADLQLRFGFFSFLILVVALQGAFHFGDDSTWVACALMLQAWLSLGLARFLAGELLPADAFPLGGPLARGLLIGGLGAIAGILLPAPLPVRLVVGGGLTSLIGVASVFWGLTPEGRSLMGLIRARLPVRLDQASEER